MKATRKKPAGGRLFGAAEIALVIQLHAQGRGRHYIARVLGRNLNDVVALMRELRLPPQLSRSALETLAGEALTRRRQDAVRRGKVRRKVKSRRKKGTR